MKKFDLGEVVITDGIARLIYEDNFENGERLNREILESLQKHQSGIWGELCEEDKQANDWAVKNGERILSAYTIDENKVKIWIITEWDRSCTTILLPEEY